MQSNCLENEHGNITTSRVEIIGGKKYIVVSHYVGNKDFKKVICDYAFRQTLAELQNKTNQ